MKSPPSERTPKPWIQRPDARLVVSVILVFHLTAVFIAPMTVVVPWELPEDRDQWPLVPWLQSYFEPYLDAAYLNHGYHFFAPDPGWSSLIHYKGERADGSTFEGTFPNLNEQWPRLLYHRHFMLTEQRSWQPPNVNIGYARHLLNVNHGEWVRLDAVRHNLTLPSEILAGFKLDDPLKYSSSEIITLHADPIEVQP